MNGTELERLAKVEQALKDFKESYDKFMTNHFQALVSKVDCIMQKMSKPRLPLWATFAITFLSSLTVGLIVYVLKK